jgi:hypothetical protein
MASRLDYFLVNVVIHLFSLLTVSDKNLRNKFKENLLELTMKSNSLRRMKILWTKLCKNWKNRSSTLILKKNSESIRRSNLRNKRRRKLRSKSKKKKLKKLSLRRKRKLPRNDIVTIWPNLLIFDHRYESANLRACCFIENIF